MNQETKKLIENGTLFCGQIIDENGIMLFKRIDISQIETLPENELGFVTTSMGRSIFRIDEEGKIHNYKGVDSHLSTAELGPASLTNARSIEYVPSENGYKISAIVFNDKKPEIRINGTSPLEDIEIEGDINKKLASFGVKVPQINYIREIPQDFSLKYGLPIKIEGSLEELQSDYALEDDQRKERLKSAYGDTYVQDLHENQRPETMREYLERIGFLASDKVKENVESLGYSMDTFIEAVDSNYSRGQRYGQAERIIGSPFRISDLETYIKDGKTEQIKTIFDFSEHYNPNFATDLANIYGKNIALIINNGWECENLAHRQDFSLAGEFCDDAYFDIFEKKREIKEKHKDQPEIAKALNGEIIRKYIGQVFHISSCIKVIQESMNLIGRNKEETDELLDTFIDSFMNNLDLQQIGQLFQIPDEKARNILFNEFSKKQSWTQKMAQMDRREGIIMDDAIYNSHIKNETYYEKVSEKLAEKIQNKSTQNKNDTNIVEEDYK